MTDNNTDPTVAARVAQAMSVHTEAPVSQAAKVRYQKLYADVILPTRATQHAAGRDIRAYLMGSKTRLSFDRHFIERGPDVSEEVPFIKIYPGQRASIPTGFKVAVPPGFEMQVRPLTDASFIKGFSIPNAPGTIGADYRDEVRVIVRNDTTVFLVIEHGERIAQCVLSAVADLPDEEVASLDTRRVYG